eukprot:m.337987 g.337987  ORF g.337987 m.337987 type:complete len:357 (-) comp18285_c0_seq1:1511-2581(-)
MATNAVASCLHQCESPKLVPLVICVFLLVFVSNFSYQPLQLLTSESKNGYGGQQETILKTTAAEQPAADTIIAVVETRFCLPEEKNPRWRGDYKAKRKMRRASAAINLQYARLHNYTFTLFCEGDSRGFASAWLKVRVLEELFLTAQRSNRPTYILLMDSDSFVSAMHMPLQTWLEQNDVNFKSSDFSIMYSNESPVPDHFKASDSKEMLNTGVAYAYADPQNVSRFQAGLKTLEYWQKSVCNECIEFQTEDKHPWEQGCLEILLKDKPSKFPTEIKIHGGHMNLWNGPWGQYVRHVWGGPGKSLRKWLFDDMIARYLINVDVFVDDIMKSNLGPRISFDRPECIAKPLEREVNTQ